jgi:NitT/TauT family transport system ATP-binding protein
MSTGLALHPAAYHHADAPALQSAIKTSNLGFCYSQPGSAFIYDNINLSVRVGEIVCLLGESGCGKSTLLRTLAGLEKPAKGTVEFIGNPLTRPHPRAALVFQQPSLLPWLSVEGNVGFGLSFRHQPRLSKEATAYRISHAIEAVGLSGKERLYPSQLSGGMMQRVALARALAREPEVLFADEPFSALDAITRAEMQALLVKVVRQWKSAAVMVTHDIDEAISIADTIVLMGGKPAHITQQWHVQRSDPYSTEAIGHGALRHDILQALQALRNPASNLSGSHSSN